ncbi:TatD family nuclease-associated radical SAM protein [Thioalkalivibrio sp.]|uniref:TatD family nuclease-associated radical SAM protein n=1 Tax=Thioalkalivibrio sp. TaxID=2093813 RepID=UPI0039770997
MAQRSRRRPRAEATLAYELHGNLYLNITYHCTLRCAFCPKFQGTWTVQGHDLLLTFEPTAEEVLEAVGAPARYEEVVFCGLGEPTLRLDTLLSVARELKIHGARHLRLNTDGLANLVHGRDVTPDLASVLDSVSVSMTAADEATYNRHTRPKRAGAYPAMLDFVRAARHQGIDVTMTAIHGLDGVDIAACERIAASLDAGFRRRELDVVG